MAVWKELELLACKLSMTLHTLLLRGSAKLILLAVDLAQNSPTYAFVVCSGSFKVATSAPLLCNGNSLLADRGNGGQGSTHVDQILRLAKRHAPRFVLTQGCVRVFGMQKDIVTVPKRDVDALILARVESDWQVLVSSMFNFA
nr:hypothetical protein Iba_chr11aCG10900 [Ipomoea batatas]